MIVSFLREEGVLVTIVRSWKMILWQRDGKAPTWVFADGVVERLDRTCLFSDGWRRVREEFVEESWVGVVGNFRKRDPMNISLKSEMNETVCRFDGFGVSRFYATVKTWSEVKCAREAIVWYVADDASSSILENPSALRVWQQVSVLCICGICSIVRIVLKVLWLRGLYWPAFAREFDTRWIKRFVMFRVNDAHHRICEKCCSFNNISIRDSEWFYR